MALDHGWVRDVLPLLMRLHVVEGLAKIVRLRCYRGVRRGGGWRLVPVNDGLRLHGRRWRQSHSGVAHDRWTESLRCLLRAAL